MGAEHFNLYAEIADSVPAHPSLRLQPQVGEDLPLQHVDVDESQAMTVAAQGATPADVMDQYAEGNLLLAPGAPSPITSLVVQRQHVVIHPSACQPCRYVCESMVFSAQ